jgi:hypothetical protein
MKKSGELKAQIIALEQLGLELRDEGDRIRHRLDEIGEELKEIYGAYSRWGKIKRLTVEYEEAKRIEDDADKPLPIWNIPESYSSEEKIISRITPKRIFLRPRGSKHETSYDRETEKSAYSGVLDIPATITVWEQSQKSKCP